MEDGGRRAGGRRAEAARNDERVLRAAREVLGMTPDAPLALVARRAQVGIGSLYRRYPSREALVARTCLEGVLELEATARVALDRVRRFPQAAFVGFLTGALADGSAPLIVGLAGTFSPDRELLAASERLQRAVRDLVESVQAAGALRPDVTAEDLVLLFQQLRAIRHDDPQRELTLRRRCLQLVLQAFHAGGAASLPGPAPDWQDLRASTVSGEAPRSSADA